MEIIFSLLFMFSTAFGNVDTQKDDAKKPTVEQRSADTGGDSGNGSGDTE